MKTRTIVSSILSAALGALLLFASCDNMTGPSLESPEVSEGMAGVRIVINGEGDSSSAKTVYPSLPFNFTKYVLSFIPLSGQPQMTDREVSPGSGAVFVEMRPGQWKIKAAAYEGETSAAWGEKTFTLSFSNNQQITSVAVNVSQPASAGTGTFSWTLDYPDNTVVTGNLVPHGGEGASIDLDFTGGKEDSNENVPAGVYQLNLTASLNDTVVKTMDLVYIFAGKESKAAFIFPGTMFGEALTVSGSAVVTDDGIPLDTYTVQVYADSGYSRLLGEVTSVPENTFSFIFNDLTDVSKLYFRIKITDAVYGDYYAPDAEIAVPMADISDLPLNAEFITLGGNIQRDDGLESFSMSGDFYVSAWSSDYSTRAGGSKVVNDAWRMKIPARETEEQLVLLAGYNSSRGYIYDPLPVSVSVSDTAISDIGVQLKITPSFIQGDGRLAISIPKDNTLVYVLFRTESSAHVRLLSDLFNIEDGRVPSEPADTAGWYDYDIDPGIYMARFSSRGKSTFDAVFTYTRQVKLDGTVSVTIQNSLPDSALIDVYDSGTKKLLGSGIVDGGSWTVKIQEQEEPVQVYFAVRAKKGSTEYARILGVFQEASLTDISGIELGNVPFNALTISGTITNPGLNLNTLGGKIIVKKSGYVLGSASVGEGNAWSVSIPTQDNGTKVNIELEIGSSIYNRYTRQLGTETLNGDMPGCNYQLAEYTIGMPAEIGYMNSFSIIRRALDKPVILESGIINTPSTPNVSFSLYNGANGNQVSSASSNSGKATREVDNLTAGTPYVVSWGGTTYGSMYYTFSARYKGDGTLTLTNMGSVTGELTVAVYSGTIVPGGLPSLTLVASGTGSAYGGEASVSLTALSSFAGSSYSILVTAGTTVRYENSVSFTDGNATVPWTDMLDGANLGVPGGGDGTLTVTGLTGSGTVTASVYSGNLTSNPTGVTPVATGTGTVSNGSAEIDLTAVSSFADGNYSIVVTVGGTSIRYKNGVTFTNKAGSANWNEMTEFGGGGDPGNPGDPTGETGTVTVNGITVSGTVNVVVYSVDLTSLGSMANTANIVAQGSGTNSDGSATVTVNVSSGKSLSDGNYAVAVTIGTSTTNARYKNGVTFSGKSASVNWDELESVQMLSAAGTLTFSDGLPSGSYTLFIVSGPIETYMQAMTAMTQYVANGGSIVSGNKVALIGTPVRPFDKNGTYSVVLMETAAPTSRKVLNGVTFNNGAATISKSSMTTLSM